MNPKHLKTLELDKVLERLAALGSFSASKELLRALQPETSLKHVRAMQAATGEAARLLASRPSLSIGGAHDVRPLASRAKLGAILAPQDFLDVLATIDSARTLRDLLHRAQLVYPELATFAGRLHPFKGLREDIAATINDRAEVVDDASPQLVHLRHEVRTGRDRIMRRLEAIIADPNNAEAIQEPIVTERNGRYVIAVKAGFRHHIRGVVHDQSESGATLFLEPLATVDMTNDWRQRQLEEQKEVERILRVLSNRLAHDAAELEETVQALAALDATFAKARLAEAMQAVEPELNADGVIDLIDARHPLLTGGVVPQTIRLGEDYRTLVITGPNTGGKTVALKTVGLLTLMAQCGLRIPAASGSKIAVFEDVLADIGDEQSIEQSLSTFSGHLRNIVDMLKTAGPRSLVLLDELGAGTDPDEGSELARSILEYLLDHGVSTIATTHYSELKTFAHNREGVQNASVEFDVNTLSPTYRLRIGTPGRSNALAIASRLGLPAEIVEGARGGLSQEHLKTESLLEEISRKERVAARERNRASREEQRLRRLRADAEHALADAARLRQDARESAYADAEAELADLRREAARLAQQLDRARSDRATVDLLREQLVEARQAQNRELAMSLQAQLTEAVHAQTAGASPRATPADAGGAEPLASNQPAPGRRRHQLSEAISGRPMPGAASRQQGALATRGQSTRASADEGRVDDRQSALGDTGRRGRRLGLRSAGADELAPSADAAWAAAESAAESGAVSAEAGRARTDTNVKGADAPSGRQGEMAPRRRRRGHGGRGEASADAALGQHQRADSGAEEAGAMLGSAGDQLADEQVPPFEPQLPPERLALYEQLAEAAGRLEPSALEELRGQLARMLQQQSREAVQEVRTRLSDVGQRLERRKPAPERAAEAVPELAIGKHVRVPGFGEPGQVLTLPDARGEVEVQVGAFRVRARAAELSKASAPRRHEPAYAFTRAAEPSTPPPSLGRPVDMRGLRADEVEPLLDRELNDAFSAGVPYVKVIHGHGSGTVRRIVRDYLAQQPYVSSFEPASPGDGGDGATIVTLAV